jgi:hypothetical protein
VQRAAEVVLTDLSFVERPAVVFVLANVDPVFAGRHGLVHPVARRRPGRLAALADPGDASEHPMIRQDGLEIFDLALLDGALR